MFNRRISALYLAAAGLLAAFSHVSLAQEAWPSRSVRLIVPTPAGAAPDVLARLVAQKLSEKWKQPVVIDNRPGASGIVGVNALLSGGADGTTFLFTQGSVLSVVPYSMKAAKYDFRRDLAPVGMVATSPLVLAVRADSPYKTLGDLLAAAKANPGTVEIADVGRTTLPHLVAEDVGLSSGVKFTHVHYQGTPAAVQDLLAGQVKGMVETYGPIIGMAQSGKVRLLANLGGPEGGKVQGAPMAGDLTPTLQHLRGVGWFSIVAKKGVDEAVLAKFNVDLNEVLRSPDVVSGYAEMAAYPRPGTREQMTAFWQDDTKTWGNLIHRLGIQPE